MWVDWGDGADAQVLQNCWYYYALSSTQKLAKALGISSDEAFFTERIQKVAAGFAKFKSREDTAQAPRTTTGQTPWRW